MRFVLALLAVMALLVQPATAAAAQAACMNDATEMTSGIAMSAMSDLAHANLQKVDPCCGHAHHKMDGRTCGIACAGACAASAAIPSTEVSFAVAFDRVWFSPARNAPILSYRPPGPERPPRSMA